eukprot:1158696-Pelagomonas_calceolata.AAC.5
MSTGHEPCAAQLNTAQPSLGDALSSLIKHISLLIRGDRGSPPCRAHLSSGTFDRKASSDVPSRANTRKTHPASPSQGARGKRSMAT